MTMDTSLSPLERRKKEEEEEGEKRRKESGGYREPTDTARSEDRVGRGGEKADSKGTGSLRGTGGTFVRVFGSFTKVVLDGCR
jgi:hypothetical protein